MFWILPGVWGLALERIRGFWLGNRGLGFRAYAVKIQDPGCAQRFCSACKWDYKP